MRIYIPTSFYAIEPHKQRNRDDLQRFSELVCVVVFGTCLIPPLITGLILIKLRGRPLLSGCSFLSALSAWHTPLTEAPPHDCADSR